MPKGFDISVWQDNNSTVGKTDFNKMAQYGSFVIIRHSFGLYKDEDFEDNWKGAKAAGLWRGAYHFLTWDVSPEQQARFFWEGIKNDLPDKFRWEEDGKYRYGIGLVVDFEWWSTVPSTAIDMLRKFVVTLREYIPNFLIGVYTAKGFWATYGNNDTYWYENTWLWSAQWGVSSPSLYGPWKSVVIWQYGTPAIGKIVGVESEEIDADEFMFPASDLFYGGNMANPYLNYAKVLYVDDKSIGVNAEMLKQYDLVLAKGVVAQSHVPKFHEYVQLAYDAGKPLIMLFEHWTRLYVSYPPNRPDLWGQYIDGVWHDMEWDVVKQALYSGGKLRAIHGVMVNASEVKEFPEAENKKVVDPQWLAKTTEYQMDLIGRESKLPTFLYMGYDVLNNYSDQDKVYPIQLIDGRGISTYYKPPAFEGDLPGWNDAKSEYHKPILPYWGKKDWDIWLYHYHPISATISGIYRGTKEALWQRLNYVPGQQPNPNPDPNPPPTPLPGTQLDRIEQMLKAVQLDIASIRKHFAD